ncbi:MAG: isochorismatase family protein [Hyphomicrobiaceae bacterium]|jgi:nicotinamidase-related amidase
MLARRRRSQLLIVDVQERLAPHIHDHARVVANCGRLIGYARRLGVPITITEHYPAGLGPTVAALAGLAGSETPRLAKIEFPGWANPAIRQRLSELRQAGRDQIVVAGMEAHVCVGQTVLELIGADFDVLVVADAVSSRSAEVRELALARMSKAGATLVAHEMIAFEWLERGDTPEFKDLIGVIK